MDIFLDWDGSDVSVFIEAIEALKYEGNTLHIKSPNTAEPVIASDYPDLYSILPPIRADRIAFYEDIPHKQYEQIIREFIQSEEMAFHIISLPQNRKRLIDIIATSPVSLWKKLSALEELAAREDLFRDILDDLCNSDNLSSHMLPPSVGYVLQSMRSFVICANTIRNALDALVLSDGDVLILAEKEYSKDPDTHGGLFGYWGFEPYLTFKAVQEYIISEFDEFNESVCEDALFWYELEKWVPSINGRMKEHYRYTFINDEPVFFDYGEPPKKESNLKKERFLRYEEESRFRFRNHLSLPVPYKPGDIVRLDCRPFAPLRFACLFDFWGSGDGEISALYRKEDGFWEERNIGYGSCMENAGYMSLLHRLRKADPSEVPNEDALLFRIQSIIAGDNENGAIFGKALEDIKKSEWSDSEIEQAITRVRQSVEN